MGECVKDGIAVAGSVLVDIINTVQSFPPEGELTSITAISKATGGCVPNVAIDLKRLDPELTVYAAGRVSNDENGAFALRTLKENGVDTSNLVVSPDNFTSFTQVMSVNGGQRTFFTYPGASADFGAEDMDFSVLCPKILHLGYFLLLDKIDRGDGLTILRRASECGIRTSIDLVSENSDRYRLVLPCLPYVDYLIVNELEGGRLAGLAPTSENIPKIAEKLMQLGVRRKVILHYREGAVCCNADGTITALPSHNVQQKYIKGSTGAGDAFCAGALLGIYRELPDETILDYGRTAAAVSLRSEDATGALVTIQQAIETCDQMKEDAIC